MPFVRRSQFNDLAWNGSLGDVSRRHAGSGRPPVRATDGQGSRSAGSDGFQARVPKSIERTELLILGDWGLSVLAATERRDLLEIPGDRHGCGFTIVTTQLPVDRWHAAIGDPTLADAILDRLVHDARRLILTGDSMRRKMTPAKPLDPTGQARPNEPCRPARPLP